LNTSTFLKKVPSEGSTIPPCVQQL
jgi:hypothetical protein